MPVEPMSAADRTRRMRQKIEAASPLPRGATASDTVSAEEGRVWRSSDGCCLPPADPHKIVIVRPNGPSYPDPTFTPVFPCTLYMFPTPLPVGTVITIHNYTFNSLDFEVGHGPISAYQSAYGGGIPPDGSATYTIAANDGVVSMYAKTTGGDCSNTGGGASQGGST